MVLIAGTISITKTKKMLLCFFYGPPDQTIVDYLDKAKEKLSYLRKRFKHAVLIIGGDFNLPDIDWSNNTVSSKFYPHRVNQTFLNLHQDLGLEQVVDFPTRKDNTLDLIFTSSGF